MATVYPVGRQSALLGLRDLPASGSTAWGGRAETHGSALNSYRDGSIPTTDPNRNLVSGSAKLRDKPVECGEAVMHRVMYKNPSSS